MEAILLDLDAAAAALSIGRRTLEGLVDSGAIPVVRIGRLVRVRRAALEAWAERAEGSGLRVEAEADVSDGVQSRSARLRRADTGQSPGLVERVAV